MLATLGYTSAEAWTERVASAERLTQQIYRIADALVALHPE
jgi:DNA-binding winged helix-turn-helix (wHTH) protein